MYEIYAKLRDKKGVKDYEVCRAAGISPSIISDWKAGKYNLKTDKLKKLAEYFGVSMDYLMTGKDTEKKSTSGKVYYFDDESAEMAQFLTDNPHLKTLLDAERNVTPEMANAIILLINSRVKQEEGRHG